MKIIREVIQMLTLVTLLTAILVASVHFNRYMTAQTGLIQAMAKLINAQYQYIVETNK